LKHEYLKDLWVLAKSVWLCVFEFWRQRESNVEGILKKRHYIILPVSLLTLKFAVSQMKVELQFDGQPVWNVEVLGLLVMDLDSVANRLHLLDLHFLWIQMFMVRVAKG